MATVVICNKCKGIGAVNNKIFEVEEQGVYSTDDCETCCGLGKLIEINPTIMVSYVNKENLYQIMYQELIFKELMVNKFGRKKQLQELIPGK